MPQSNNWKKSDNPEYPGKNFIAETPLFTIKLKQVPTLLSEKTPNVGWVILCTGKLQVKEVLVCPRDDFEGAKQAGIAYLQRLLIQCQDQLLAIH